MLHVLPHCVLTAEGEAGIHQLSVSPPPSTGDLHRTASPTQPAADSVATPFSPDEAGALREPAALCLHPPTPKAHVATIKMASQGSVLVPALSSSPPQPMPTALSLPPRGPDARLYAESSGPRSNPRGVGKDSLPSCRRPRSGWKGRVQEPHSPPLALSTSSSLASASSRQVTELQLFQGTVERPEFLALVKGGQELPSMLSRCWHESVWQGTGTAGGTLCFFAAGAGQVLFTAAGTLCLTQAVPGG